MDNRISTRVNLLRRRVLRYEADVMYPLCGEEPKFVNHLFVTCEVASTD